MATTILLKRSVTTATPASLANGEPAYSANGDVFYIGSNGAIVAIGGKRVPGVLTANQALVTNSTNMIDTVMFGNSTVNSFANSLGFTLANSTVSFTYTKPTAAQKTSGDYFPNSGGGWSQVSGGTTNPGGSNTNIQFNDSGSFGADAALDWDKVAKAFTVGNSTVNVVTNSSSVAINGSTLVSNTLGVFVGANVNVGMSGVVIGNSTVNTFVNSSTLTFNAGQVVVNNSVIQNGSNVNISTARFFVGNSTVNSVSNSSQHVIADASATATLTSTTLTVGILGGAQINSAANLSVSSANVSMPNANLTVKDLNLSGNLVVLGAITTIDTTNMQVKDSIIKLADQNAADVIDEGFYAQYNDGSTRFRGLIYDASNGNFMLFSNTLAEPSTTLDTSNTSLSVATLRSWLSSGNLVSNSSGVAIGANSTYAVTIVANTLSLTTALPVGSGGTGVTTVASQAILIGNGTSPMTVLNSVDGGVLQCNSTQTFFGTSIDCGTF